jgi:hypothetical protein
MNTTAPAAADDASPLADIEPALGDLRTLARMMVHLAESSLEVDPEEWLHLQSQLIDVHGRLHGLWQCVWDEQKAEHAAAAAALAAAKAERAAPGSVEDVKSAHACWSMLRTAAKVMLDYSNDALQPQHVTPRKAASKVTAKRRAKAA